MDIKIQLLDSKIDLANEIGFGLNYSIDDIRNVEKKNTNYSKTITLAGSDNNNTILGGLFDVNADFTYFNPNIKTPAKIVVNSEVVIDGFLQLKSIETQGKIVYKCVINSNAVDFFTDIKEKELSELDFSDYNHVYNQTSIENSWNNTRGYVYPLLYKRNREYETTDFKPAIFHKEYVKRIALESGYSLGGTLMDETTEEGGHYAREIIPFNGKDVIISDAELERRLFKAGQTSSSINIVDNTIGSGQSLNIPTFRLEVLDNDSTDGNFDNGNFYSAYKYSPDLNGSYALSFDFSGRIQFFSGTTDCYRSLVVTDSNGFVARFFNRPANYYIEFIVYKNGNATNYRKTQNFSAPQSLTSANNHINDFYFNINLNTPNLNLLASDELEIKYRVSNLPLNGVLEYTEESSGVLALTNVPVSYKITSFNSGTSLKNTTGSSILQDGDTINVNNFIPKKVKQSDIITDLIKRYNAYISIDPDNERRIILDTRESFFAKGPTLDWSDKFDNDSKIDIKLISELQNKEYLFTYKEDNDYLNDRYTTETNGAIWGEKEVIFNNDFVKGVKKIETPFSPTPLVAALVGGKNFAIVPSIDTIDPETNIRVLYYGGLIECLNDSDWSFNGSSKLTYPYAGHLDNPINPTIDINFGQTPLAYYTEFENRTNASLYNRFWDKYVQQLATGKLVTMYLYLNTTDISYIRHNLNAKVYVNNSYYYINKIIDYNPLKQDITKVEFLKIDEGVSFFSKPIPRVIQDITKEDDIKILPVKDLRKNQDDGINNSVKGEGNYFTEESKDSQIIGNNNVVRAERAVVQGNNNFVSAEAEGAFVFGANNKDILEANQGYLGDLFIKDGVINKDANKIVLADIITKRNNSELIEGDIYNAIDRGLFYQAIKKDAFSISGWVEVKCLKISTYSGISFYKEGSAYNVNDLVIYGNRIWECVNDSSDLPVNYYTLNSDFEEQFDSSYYEVKLLRCEFKSDLETIISVSDERGNKVIDDTHGGFYYSDWNAPNIENNICFGFMNNEGEVKNNNCKLIGNNIINNIKDNKNNGNIVRNLGLIDIKDNINNGDIGNFASQSLRGSDVTDPIVNK